ncbi:MAG: hypothetical protein WKF71_11610 [Pyrinomonadaceae bacterium]
MLDVEKGAFVRVKSEQYNVSIISVVRGRHHRHRQYSAPASGIYRQVFPARRNRINGKW